LWGKRRGDRDAVNKNEDKDVDNGTIIDSMTQNTTPFSSSSPIENNRQFDYVEEEEDDDDDDKEEDSGKKRMRKPVKARSLKSFM
jgi:hypothetical protein